MLRAHRNPRVGVLLPLLLLTPLAGCASTGDVDSLRAEIKASSARVESLQGETRKQLDERDRQLTQDIKAVQAAVVKLTDALKENQARLTEVAGKTDALVGRTEGLAKESKEVRAALQTSHRALLEFLESEEVQLKSSLTVIQSLRKELAANEKPKEKEAAAK